MQIVIFEANDKTCHRLHSETDADESEVVSNCSWNFVPLEKFLALVALETSLDEFNRIGGVFQIQPDAGSNTKTTTKRKYECWIIEMSKDKLKSVFLFPYLPFSHIFTCCRGSTQ